MRLKSKIIRGICYSVILLICVLCIVYPFLLCRIYDEQQELIIGNIQKLENSSQSQEELRLCEVYNEMVFKWQLFGENHYEVIQSDYSKRLNTEHGIMGYIEIPKINVTLPIYHSTDDDVLEKGVGHLMQSSMPIGGKNTHAVLTGHSGVLGKPLFTDLEDLEIDDYFCITTCGRTLYYKIDQIKTVVPHNTEDLLIEPGNDQITLVTCTPFGINSHRLLVRGSRVNKEECVSERTVANNHQYESKWIREYKKSIENGIIYGVFYLLTYFIIVKMKTIFRIYMKNRWKKRKKSVTIHLKRI